MVDIKLSSGGIEYMPQLINDVRQISLCIIMMMVLWSPEEQCNPRTIISSRKSIVDIVCSANGYAFTSPDVTHGCLYYLLPIV